MKKLNYKYDISKYKDKLAKKEQKFMKFKLVASWN